jgi:hypothetical protein
MIATLRDKNDQERAIVLIDFFQSRNSRAKLHLSNRLQSVRLMFHATASMKARVVLQLVAVQAIS